MYQTIISHTYLQIPLPESVTGRYSHSLTEVTMSPNCVWLVIVGGCEEFMRMLQEHTLITDTNRVIMIIELGKEDCYHTYCNDTCIFLISVYIEAGEWIVQSLLDGNDLTSKKYQEKYSSYSKTRTWWIDQLIEYPAEKEMKLQRYIQSLHQELQVAHQNKVSLQEALTEANKQGTCTCTCTCIYYAYAACNVHYVFDFSGSKVDGNKLVISKKLEEVLQERKIITG